MQILKKLVLSLTFKELIFVALLIFFLLPGSPSIQKASAISHADYWVSNSACPNADTGGPTSGTVIVGQPIHLCAWMQDWPDTIDNCYHRQQFSSTALGDYSASNDGSWTNPSTSSTEFGAVDYQISDITYTPSVAAANSTFTSTNRWIEADRGNGNNCSARGTIQGPLSVSITVRPLGPAPFTVYQPLPGCDSTFKPYISLSWATPSTYTGTLTFNILRSDGQSRTGLSGSTTTVSDYNVTPGASYSYTVTAIDSNGSTNGTPSPTGSATVTTTCGPPPDPFWITGTSLCLGNVPDNQINWFASPGAVKYLWERWGLPTNGFLPWLTPNNSYSSWDDTNFFGGTMGPTDDFTYTYRVTAFNQYGATFSTPQFITVKTANCLQPILDLIVQDQNGKNVNGAYVNVGKPITLNWWSYNDDSCTASTTSVTNTSPPVTNLIDPTDNWTGSKPLIKLLTADTVTPSYKNSTYTHTLTCYNNNVGGTWGHHQNSDLVSYKTSPYDALVNVSGTLQDPSGGTPTGAVGSTVDSCTDAGIVTVISSGSKAVFNIPQIQGSEFCVTPPILPGYFPPVAKNRNSSSAFTNKYDFQIDALSCATGKVNASDVNCTAFPAAATEDRDYIGNYLSPTVDDSGYDFVYTPHPPVLVTCDAYDKNGLKPNPQTFAPNVYVQWRAHPSGGSGSYSSYSWSGAISGPTQNVSTSTGYPINTTQTANVVATDSDGISSSPSSCSINIAADLIGPTILISGDYPQNKCYTKATLPVYILTVDDNPGGTGVNPSSVTGTVSPAGFYTGTNPIPAVGPVVGPTGLVDQYSVTLDPNKLTAPDGTLYTVTFGAYDNASPPNPGSNQTTFIYRALDCSRPYFTTSGGDVHSNVRIKQPVP